MSTRPDPPTNILGIGGISTLTISWTPATTGGPVSSFTAVGFGIPTNITKTVSSNISTTTLTAVNGRQYIPLVFANGPPGSGSSIPPGTTTPATMPLPPTTVRVVYTNTTGDAEISWTPPTNNGGANISSYTIYSNSSGSAIIASTTTTSTIVNGFTYGTPYTFTATAVNSAGESVRSAASAPFTPIMLPTSPINVAANMLSSGMSISWETPASSGGTPITGYTILNYIDSNYVAPSTVINSAAISSIILSTLSNGATYEFGVMARNIIGLSPQSNVTSNVLYYNKPAAVFDVNATKISTTSSASVSWVNSSQNFNISSFNITTIPSTTLTTTSNLSAVVSGLTYGVSYRFSVTATNIRGTSLPTSSFIGVTPLTVPNAPSTATATPGGSLANISWTSPTFNGGTSISGYRITRFDSSGNSEETTTVLSNISSLRVSGLPVGNIYVFGVTATNSIGISLSTLTSSIIITGPPSIPTNVSSISKNTAAILNWTLPLSYGLPISSYTFTTTPAGGSTVYYDSSGGYAVIGGLTNGTPYTISVRANNSDGAGPLARTLVTPTSAVVIPPYIPNPGLVTGPRIYAQSGNFVSIFAGSNFQNFSYAIPIGAWSTMSSISTMTQLTPGATNSTISGNISLVFPQSINVELKLNNGENNLGPTTVTYISSSAATLLSGAGGQFSTIASSNWDYARYIQNTIQTKPLSPINIAVEPLNRGATIQWSTPQNSFNIITAYTFTTSPTGGVCLDYNMSTNKAVIGGLSNNTPYTISIRAIGLFESSDPALSPSVTPNTANLFGYVSTPTNGSNNFAKAGPYVTIFGKVNYSEFNFAIPVGLWTTAPAIREMSQITSAGGGTFNIYGNDGPSNVSVVFPTNYDLMLILNNGNNFSGPTTLIYTRTTPFGLQSGAGGQFLPPGPTSNWESASTIWCKPVTTTGALTNLTVTPTNGGAILRWSTPITAGGLSNITNYTFTTSPPGGVLLNYNLSTNTAVFGSLSNNTPYTISITSLSPMGISPVATSPSVTPNTANLFGYTPTPQVGSYYLAKSREYVSIFGKVNYAEFNFAIPVGLWTTATAIRQMSQITSGGAQFNIYGNDGPSNVSVVFPAEYNLMLILNNGDNFSGPTTLIYTRTTPFGLQSGGGGQFLPPGPTSNWNSASTIWCKPITTTGALTNLTVSPTNGGVILRWSTPITAGGLSTITNYTFTTSPPGGVLLNYNLSTNTAVIGSLSNNTPYTISITSLSPMGISPVATSPSVTPNTANLFGYTLTPTNGSSNFAKAGPYVSIFGKVNYNEFNFAIPVGLWSTATAIREMSQITSGGAQYNIYGNDGPSNVSVVFPAEYNLMLVLNNGNNFSGPTTLIYTRTTPLGLQSGAGGQFLPPGPMSNWESASTIWCKPITTTGALTNLTVSPTNGGAILRWSTPITAGGLSTITNYRITTSPAGGVASSYNLSTNTAVISSLTNNIPYTISITSLSPIGVSPVATSPSVIPS